MHQLPTNCPLAIVSAALCILASATDQASASSLRSLNVVHSAQTQNRTTYQQTSYWGLRRDDEHGPTVHQEDHWHYNRPVAARLETDSSPSSSAPSLKRAMSFLSRPSARPTTLSAIPNIRPRVPNLPVPIPSDEGLQCINTAFGANVARFTSLLPHLAGITFPSGAPQQLGRLITTFHTAIRVAYDLFCNLNASPADSIITLLSLGASYCIMTPMPAVRSSLAHTAGVYPHITPPPYLDTRIQYSGMNLKGTDYWHQYLLHSLMGIESCWPPQDVWESSSRWMEFWTDADEKWFQTHLLNLSSGNLAALKTCRNWKRSFWPTAAVRLGDSAGTEIFAHSLLQDLGYCTDKEPCWDLSVYANPLGQLPHMSQARVGG
ncbi:uncharacterized protein EDB91DRAFT_1086293 [Suillus paluster]|uniref:uncharacterized protein n=1 Tax=Suillus paluster TaxID=48578 RepID=UPI001B8792DE|nr:uncharacterized protein EDB91DRAFT_1086293 [Suillus paluster]KAG1727770.1 hypothetical protein EDB91DRAFT_1086293 [Suillus paluster]